MKWQATAPHDDGFERYSCTLAAGHGNPGCLFRRWHHLGSPCRCVPPLVQGHDQLGPLGRQRQLPEQFAAELLNKVVVVAVTRSPRQRPGPRTGQQCRRCRAGCVAAAPASSRHLSPKTKRLLGAAAIVVVVLLAALDWSA